MIHPGKRCQYCEQQNFECVVSKDKQVGVSISPSDNMRVNINLQKNAGGMDNAHVYDPNKPKAKCVKHKATSPEINC